MGAAAAVDRRVRARRGAGRERRPGGRDRHQARRVRRPARVRARPQGGLLRRRLRARPGPAVADARLPPPRQGRALEDPRPADDRHRQGHALLDLHRAGARARGSRRGRRTSRSDLQAFVAASTRGSTRRTATRARCRSSSPRPARRRSAPWTIDDSMGAAGLPDPDLRRRRRQRAPVRRAREARWSRSSASRRGCGRSTTSSGRSTATPSRRSRPGSSGARRRPTRA